MQLKIATFGTAKKLLHGYASHQQVEETNTLIEQLHFIEQKGLETFDLLVLYNSDRRVLSNNIGSDS